MATTEKLQKISSIVAQQTHSITEIKSVISSMSTELDLILNLLGIDPHQSSNMEESPDSIGDFTVSPSEEIKSTSIGVDEKKDSLELAYVPPFFLAENEADSSTDVVSFEFKETSEVTVNDFDRNNHINTEINGFSKLSPVTFDNMKDIEMQFCVKISEKNFDISANLMKLFLLHNKLLRKDCVGLRRDDTRSLFDRGKCTVIPSLTYTTLLLQLLLSLRHDSELQFIHSFPHLCVNDFAIHVAKKMFVHITERDRFLLFLLAKVITFEMDNQLMFHMVDMRRAVNFLLLMLHKIQFASTIFFHSFIQEHCRNRGTVQGLSYSVVDYQFSIGLSNSCSIVPACMIYTGGVCFYLYFVYTCSLFDRGKGFDRSIFTNNYNGTFNYILVLNHGHGLELLYANSTVHGILMIVVLVMTVRCISKCYK
ncbi:uncharacterized protein LOC113338384 [Papaver somniferum]|uniref:uncharacterized protein LOC113338384 n=1 Tax=Papaver somniferum TaxID=3469 RepID=UPI000E6FFE83|nr:uncharacterized protein LOC113338384 [Papaver somniferum]